MSNRRHATVDTPVPRLMALSIGLTCVLTFGFSGCGHHDRKMKPMNLPPATVETPQNQVTVYFSKNQGNHSIVEEVARPLPDAEKTTPIQFALGELLKGPSADEKSDGFYSEIPKGTELLGVRTDPQTITVDLSKQFNGGGGSNSIEQRFQELKKTIYSIDSTHKLNLSVEGKPLELLGGEGLEVQDSLKRDSR